MNDANSQSLRPLIDSRVENAAMAFLGGSQVANHGRDRLPGSDYDVVVLSPHAKYPLSYNNLTYPGTGSKVDLIVRDPETLQFEIEEARRHAKAAVIKIIAEGQCIFDETGRAEEVQEKMRQVIAEGPAPVGQNVYTGKLAWLVDVLPQYQAFGDKPYKLAGMEAIHETAGLLLRARRQWIATGKILARQVTAFPELKEALEKTYQHKDFTALGKMLVQEKESVAFADDTKDLTFLTAEQEPDPIIRDKFLVRYSDAYLARMMHGSSGQQRIARQFAGNKLLCVMDAVHPDRFDRPSNEYFYALTRVVFTMAGIVQAKENAPHDRRYLDLVEYFPGFHDAVVEAEKGQPALLKEMVCDFALELDPRAGGEFIRYSPSTFRSPTELSI